MFFLLPRAGFRCLLLLLPQLHSVHVELRSAPSQTPSLFPSLFPHLPQIINPPEATSTMLWYLGFPTGCIQPLAALPAPARWAQHPQPQGTASRWLPAIPVLVPKAPFSSLFLPGRGVPRAHGVCFYSSEAGRDGTGRDARGGSARGPLLAAPRGGLGAGRGDAGGAAGCGQIPCDAGAGRKPTSPASAMICSEKGRELRLKKALLRSETLARTVPHC